MMAVPVQVPSLLILGAVLFAFGLIGVLLRRNGLSALMGLQLMCLGCYLALAAFPVVHGTLPVVHGAAGGGIDGRVTALFALAVGAAQVVVTLSLLTDMRRQRHTVDVEEASELRW